MRLGHIVRTESGERPPDAHGDVPVIGAGGQMGTTGRSNVPAGSILVGRVGTVGSVHTPDVPVWATDNTLVVAPTVDVNRRWLSYVLHSAGMADLAKGNGTAQPLISGSQLRDIRCRPFPLEEQRRIADFLDDRVSRIDRIIAARREQIISSGEAFDAWWDSSMRRLGQYNDVVPMRRVLTSIADGPFGSSLTSRHYADSGTRVIRLGNIGVATFRNDDRAFIPNDYAKTLANHSVSTGDLVMAGLGDDRWPLGRCAVVPDIGPAIVKADCYRIRLHPVVSHEYAAIALSSPHVRSQLAMLGRGATRARLNTEVARESPLVLLPLAKQASYTSEWNGRRDEMEEMQRALNESVGLLTEYKSSLITAAVTGELDVSTAGSSIPG